MKYPASHYDSSNTYRVNWACREHGYERAYIEYCVAGAKRPFPFESLFSGYGSVHA